MQERADVRTVLLKLLRSGSVGFDFSFPSIATLSNLS
jgi:hypothetical protein